MQSAYSEETDDDIDATNHYIATKWDQFNRSLDTFFTNKSSLPNENKSSIFLYSSFNKKEGTSLESEYDFQLKFDLPNTTKKLKIVIEKEQNEISKALSNTSSTAKVISKDGKTLRKKDAKYTAGTNFLLKKSNYFVSFIHFGIRLDMPLNPSVKFDIEKDVKNKYVNVALSQKIMMYRQEGLQEISQITFYKKLRKNLWGDLVNSLVWSDETDIFVLRNNLIFTHEVGNEKILSYSFGANAKLSPTFYYDSYDASVSYRQLLYKDWLYGTFAIGAEFPKVDSFDDRKFVQLRFDVFFKD